MFIVTPFDSEIEAQFFTKKLPQKWIPMGESEDHVKWFNSKTYVSGAKYKSQILKDKGVLNSDYVFYSNDAIKELNKRLKNEISDPGNQRVNIYITYYTGTPANCIPPIKVNQLIFVYAPASPDRKDLGKYFIIIENKCYEISKACKDSWFDDYNKYINTPAKDKSTVVDGLTSTIERTGDNYDKTEYSDTKFVSYVFDEFSEFIHKEKKYQLRKFKEYEIIGMVVDYAAYSDKGYKNYHKGRFILQFDFAKKGTNGYDKVYIDKESNFEKRKRKTENSLKKSIWSKSGYENWKKENPSIKDKPEYNTYDKWLKQMIAEFEIKGFDHSELCPDVCN